MVVAPQPIAASAGLEVLAKGGNAFDAAVATAFAQGVVEPQMNGIGGFGNAVCVTAAGEAHDVGFYGRIPKAFPPDLWQDQTVSVTRSRFLVKGFENQVGYRSVTTPGTVAGLFKVHQLGGDLPWQTVIEPAIELARNGFPVPWNTYSMWREDESSEPDAVPMLEKLGLTAASREIYLKPDGSLFRPGETLVHKMYGATLEAIAIDGPETFYTGQIGSLIASDFQEHGGFLDSEDLASYRAELGSPVSTTYRGYEVITNDLPSGGWQLLLILNILEGFNLSEMDPTSPDYIDLIARCMQASFVEKANHLADPDFHAVPRDMLISKEFAGALRERVISREEFQVPLPEELGDVEDCPDTTHVSAADNAGNAVSITHSLGTASGVVSSKLGFMYNNGMHLFNPLPGYPTSIAPGKRRSVGRIPTIVKKSGKPVLVLGAPGGSRIVGAVLLSLLGVLDHGKSPAEAVASPRWHCESDALELEARLYWNLREAMKERGWRIVRGTNSSYDPFFARAQAIRIGPVGELSGGGDPRGGGGLAKWPL